MAKIKIDQLAADRQISYERSGALGDKRGATNRRGGLSPGAGRRLPNAPLNLSQQLTFADIKQVRRVEVVPVDLLIHLACEHKPDPRHPLIVAKVIGE